MVNLNKDEVAAVIEELSHRPYRDVYQMIAILAARAKESEPASESKIFTGTVEEEKQA